MTPPSPQPRMAPPVCPRDGEAEPCGRGPVSTLPPLGASASPHSPGPVPPPGQGLKLPGAENGVGKRQPQSPEMTPGLAIASEAVAGPGIHPAAKAMSERQLETAVRKILADVSALVPDGDVLGYHTYYSKASAAGFPDWIFAGPGGVLYRELKTERGRVGVAQVMWRRCLRLAGADADVWRPSDLLSGRIARELAALAGLGGAR